MFKHDLLRDISRLCARIEQRRKPEILVQSHSLAAAVPYRLTLTKSGRG